MIYKNLDLAIRWAHEMKKIEHVRLFFLKTLCGMKIYLAQILDDILAYEETLKLKVICGLIEETLYMLESKFDLGSSCADNLIGI